MAEEKLKILYLMQMLLEETDPAHPMNATQLCERMQSRYEYSYNRKTIYLQLIILIYGVFSGKLGVKKWLILLNPVCGLIVGIVLGAVLPGNLSGIPMGMRNLGEGLMYLIPYAYWQNHRA